MLLLHTNYDMVCIDSYLYKWAQILQPLLKSDKSMSVTLPCDCWRNINFVRGDKVENEKSALCGLDKTGLYILILLNF